MTLDIRQASHGRPVAWIVKRGGRETLGDPATQLKVLRDNWSSTFEPDADDVRLFDVRRLLELRNRWAHFRVMDEQDVEETRLLVEKICRMTGTTVDLSAGGAEEIESLQGAIAGTGSIDLGLAPTSTEEGQHAAAALLIEVGRREADARSIGEALRLMLQRAWTPTDAARQLHDRVHRLNEPRVVAHIGKARLSR